MGSKWEAVAIEEIAEKVGIGPFGSSIKIETFVPDGIPVVSGSHLKGIRLSEESFNYITEEHADRLKNANVYRGDVVFTHAGTIGQVAYIPKNSRYNKYILSQRQFYLRPNLSRATPEFITYYFKSPDGQHKLLANASSSGVPSIAQPVSYLRKIELQLPPLPTQKAIAHILGTLDDKIELLRSMNETLEAMARALFKSWFIDFDPVRKKVEGQPTGLPPEIDALFPDSFENSELGEIPKGWKVDIIESIAEKIGMGPFGSNLLISTFVDTGVPVISGKHLSGILLEDSSFNHVTKTHAERLKNSIVKRGDLVFTHAGTIGQVSYIPNHSLYDEYLLSQRQFYLRCDENKIPHIFMIYYFSSPAGQHRLLANASQVGVPSISRPVTNLKSIPLTIPRLQTANFFADQVNAYHNIIEFNIREVACLTKVRDSLLPKLISGELDLSDQIIKKILEPVK